MKDDVYIVGGGPSLKDFYTNFVKALETVAKNTGIQVISHSKISRLNKVIPYSPFKASTAVAKPLNPP